MALLCKRSVLQRCRVLGCPLKLSGKRLPGRDLKPPCVNNQRSHLEEELLHLQNAFTSTSPLPPSLTSFSTSAKDAQQQQQQQQHAVVASVPQSTHHHVHHHHSQHHHNHASFPLLTPLPAGVLHAAAHHSAESLANAVALSLVRTGSVSVRVRDTDDQVDCFLRGLSLAAAFMDRAYGVTLCFEAFEDSNVRASTSRSSSHGHGGHGHHHHHPHSHAGGRGSGAAVPAERVTEPVREYVALIQLAQRSEQANELPLRYEPIRAGTHSDSVQLAEELWDALVAQGATWVRCTWGVGGRTTRVPAVLSALCRAARNVRARLGMAIKVVPRLVHDKDKHGAVVYLSLFNYPVV